MTSAVNLTATFPTFPAVPIDLEPNFFQSSPEIQSKNPIHGFLPISNPSWTPNMKVLKKVKKKVVKKVTKPPKIIKESGKAYQSYYYEKPLGRFPNS